MLRPLVYEVRARFDTPALRERYLRWLIEEGHVRAVIAAGALDGEVRLEGEGVVISRYRFASAASFAAYEAGPAIALRAEGRTLFPEGMTAERSVSSEHLVLRRTPLSIVPVPCLSDNYAYLVIDRDEARAVVIDPSEAAPVEAALREHDVALVGIWCTHHHHDHVGGNLELAHDRGGVEIVASAHDQAGARVPGQTRAVSDGDELSFGGRAFQVVAIPGHTMGAVAYVGDGVAFTGDTLFSGGCGRVFEGTMPMMRASLEKLMQLPEGTRIYSGHEYTVKNLAFAATVEPGSRAVRDRLAAAEAQRAEGRPTVGATLREELATNPFLRWQSPEVVAFAAARGEASDPDQVFSRVREAKNAS